MYIIKNLRNYIPLLGVALSIFFLKYGSNLDYSTLSLVLGIGSAISILSFVELVIVGTPFVLVPILNILTTVLNTLKFKRGKKLYFSIVFSFVIQLLPLIIVLRYCDDKGAAILIYYCIYLAIVDVVSLLYPLVLYKLSAKLFQRSKNNE